MKTFTLKITDKTGGVHYLTVKNDYVSLCTPAQTPCALSNIASHDAFLMDFELKKARSVKKAIEITRRYIYSHLMVEAL